MDEKIRNYGENKGEGRIKQKKKRNGWWKI